MKRILSLLFAFIVIISFGTSTKADATSSTDLLERDAKISAEAYSLLLDRAGFTSYIYMDEEVDIARQNPSNFRVEERFEDFLIGKFNGNAIKVMVTKDGLIAAYVPKNYGHTIFDENSHFQDVKSAVKVFVGPTIEKTNYINFASLGSNKAVSFYGEDTEEITIPLDARINDIGLAAYTYQSYGDLGTKSPVYEGYGPIPSRSLEAGSTHTISNQGRYIDTINVFAQDVNSMNIFYTSDTPIEFEGVGTSRNYDLVNTFKVDTSVVPDKSLVSLKIKEETKNMKLGAVQTIQLTGLYSDGSQEKISPTEAKWTLSKPAVAKFLNGKLEALAPGSTTLSVSYKGKTTFVVINVEDYNELPRKENQPVNKTWNITFSAPIKLDTAVEKNIYVTDDKGELVPTSHVISSDYKIIRLVPKKEYTPGKTYTVWVKDVKSATGKTIKQYTKMDFTIKK